jgi:serine/threonine-protein kinase
MATVHMGRQFGDAGFSRVVAIKRLLPQFGLDSEFEAMFVEEVRLAARIKHPNVVQTLDVVATNSELLLIMDYVHGESLWRLFRVALEQSKPVPLNIVSAIVVDVLHGLHAAHEATDRHGNPLRIVHRDVSPHNVIVGDDGVSRVFDFGIAKAADSTHFTERGTIRGKTAYMAPEQLDGKTASRQTDIFAVGVVLWELLTNRRLFAANGCASIAQQIAGDAPRPSTLNPSIPAELEAVVMTTLSRDPARRHANARRMAIALETSCRTATKSEVSSWVRSLAGHTLDERARLAHLLESSGVSVLPPPGGRDARGGPRAESTAYRYSSGVVEAVRPRAPEIAASPRPVSRTRLPAAWKVGIVVLIIAAVVGALAWIGAARALGAPL